MLKDYMYTPPSKPQAKWNRSSKQYKAQAKQLQRQRLSKLKEWCVVIGLVLICSIDLEPLLDVLL